MWGQVGKYHICTPKKKKKKKKKKEGCKNLDKCVIYHLWLRINPQVLQICNIFTRSKLVQIHFFVQTVYQLQVPKYSVQCISVFSCSLFYPHVVLIIILRSPL